MFGLFKKKEKRQPSTNYGSIAVDMHSHVLPGIDDGAQNVDESLFLIGKMMDAGIRKVIATPHIMIDFYRNTPETINGALETLRAELKNRGIDIEVEAAAEHYFDETLEKRIDDKKLMTMGDNYVLYEYPFIGPPHSALQVLQKLTAAGYKPILAHPERYGYMTIEEMADLRTWGANIQLNTISLTGYYGKAVREKAEAMVDAEIVDFISSDMHHPKHAAAFHNALNFSYVEKLLTNYPLKNVMLK